MTAKFNRYVVCLLDVLGFKSAFSSLGLEGIADRYFDLVDIVIGRNQATERFFGPLNFSEGAYHVSDGDAFVAARMYGAYASDSIILFAHADFPENRYPAALESTPEERKLRAQDRADGWRYHTIPCDPFLDLCNEVICHSIEIGLPVRGALSMGEAILHLDRGIYLGQPLIDAAVLETQQECMGASFARSFMDQVIPKRYKLSHSSHMKSGDTPFFAGVVLDWPRHWRATRGNDPAEAVRALGRGSSAKKYYDNTVKIIEASQAEAHLHESPADRRITSVYPQFSGPDVELRLRLVRD